jgi:hypothetical protein
VRRGFTRSQPVPHTMLGKGGTRTWNRTWNRTWSTT